jgi:hypothetical protein
VQCAVRAQTPEETERHIAFILEDGADQVVDMLGPKADQVGIDEGDQVGAGGLDAEEQGGGLPVVDLRTQHFEPAVRRRGGTGSRRSPIIYQDDTTHQRGAQRRSDDRRDVFGLVVRRDEQVDGVTAGGASGCE